MLGVLLIDKPTGMTSHDVVNVVRRRLGIKRVGHAGTLDPMATGVLVVAVGPATRFLQYLPLEPKEYVGEIQFGVETETQDAEGPVVQERPVPSDFLERAIEALPNLTGEIDQLPPMFSAVKREGRPLYDYARKGQTVERASRRVFVHDWELAKVAESRARFRVVCSGGTYVRTLAHDLGTLVGCGAHLASLVRTRVGKFDIERCVALEDAAVERLVPLREALPPMPLVPLDERQAADVWEGRAIRTSLPLDAKAAALLDPTGGVMAVARLEDGVLRPECVIPREALAGPV